MTNGVENFYVRDNKIPLWASIGCGTVSVAAYLATLVSDDKDSYWFWLGVASAATFNAIYFAGFYRISKYREKKRLRLEYERELGSKPPKSFSSQDIRDALEHHKEELARQRLLHEYGFDRVPSGYLE